MKKKLAVFALSAVLFALSVSASAQQPKKIPRIGFLAANPSASRQEAFREGLHELGYVEGKNIVIEWRRPMDNSIGYLSLQLSSFDSRWTL